ncbi:MAG: response regulator [Zetaproteobacteria bacterium CG2_30_46_52]|nr:MAG: response regulator [Zetaproteobacteria bacterium CG2_30_46_52]
MNTIINILAIDDENTVQSVIAAFLNRYLDEKNLVGNIKTLNDPVQGLFELSTNGDHYQIILLDVHMPELSGDEIYSKILQTNPALLHRVMFITGYAEDLKHRFPQRVLNILEKPFRYQTFCDKIDQLLEQQ